GRAAGRHGQAGAGTGGGDEQQGRVEFDDDLADVAAVAEPDPGAAAERVQPGGQGGHVVGAVRVEAVHGLHQSVAGEQDGAGGVRYTLPESAHQPVEVGYDGGRCIARRGGSTPRATKVGGCAGGGSGGGQQRTRGGGGYRGGGVRAVGGGGGGGGRGRGVRAVRGGVGQRVQVGRRGARGGGQGGRRTGGRRGHGRRGAGRRRSRGCLGGWLRLGVR